MYSQYTKLVYYLLLKVVASFKTKHFSNIFRTAFYLSRNFQHYIRSACLLSIYTLQRSGTTRYNPSSRSTKSHLKSIQYQLYMQVSQDTLPADEMVTDFQQSTVSTYQSPAQILSPRPIIRNNPWKKAKQYSLNAENNRRERSQKRKRVNGSPVVLNRSERSKQESPVAVKTKPPLQTIPSRTSQPPSALKQICAIIIPYNFNSQLLVHQPQWISSDNKHK